MSASQFVFENIIAVLGGVGVVVTGLSTFLGKLVSEKSILREKIKLQAELQSQKEKHEHDLKLLEKDLQVNLAKSERFSQISKTTFENIFSKRIDVYSKLTTLRTEYYAFINEGHEIEVDDDAIGGFQSLFSKCRNLIEDNRLYISSELSKAYDAWLSVASPFYKEVNISGYEIHLSSYDDGQRYNEFMAAEAVIFSRMIRATIEEMTKVFDQIENDVELMRDAIDMKHLTSLSI